MKSPSLTPERRAEIVAETTRFVQIRLASEGTGHDWWHISRVLNHALRINRVEKADPFIVRLAALLHDIADHKFHGGDSTVGPRVARDWLRSQGVPSSIVTHVAGIIRDLSYKGAGTSSAMSTLEGRIVQDADRLDALGAIGIARAFAYGGHKNREMHDPEVLPQTHRSFAHYKKSTSTTLNHFHEKLLLLKDRMHTPTARKMARTKHLFLLRFLAAFEKEWGPGFRASSSRKKASLL